MAEPIVCVGCGSSIPVLDDNPNWSLRTEFIGGVEYIVERHLSLPCPQCGISETRVSYDAVGRALLDERGEPLRFFNLVVVPVDPPEPFEAP